MFRKKKIKKFILGKTKIYLRHKNYLSMNNACRLIKTCYHLVEKSFFYKLKLNHYV